MKKLLLILFACIMTLSLQAQYKNVLYFTGNFMDWSKGARYDRYFDGWGLYASYAKGTYHDRHTNAYIYDHTRTTIGYIYKLPYIEGQIDNPILSLGFICHEYGEIIDPEDVFNNKAHNPYGFEVGWGGSIKRINFGVRLDTRIEVGLDIGFNF